MLGLLTVNPLLFVLAAATLLVAITVHEFAHAYAAEKLGDPTPRLQGRLTLNPLAHLDPVGTLGLLLFGFGWGKPVQFDPYNLKNPRRDTAIISFAGPLSNILVVTIVSLIYRIFLAGPFEIIPVTIIIAAFIRLNLSLAIFNLIPIHPLDGGKILVGLLPHHESRTVDRFLHQYGTILLIALIFFPLIGGHTILEAFLSPIINLLMNVYMPGRFTV